MTEHDLTTWAALAEAAMPGPWFARTEEEAGDWPTIYTTVRGYEGDDLVAETYYWEAEAVTGHHNLTHMARPHGR